MATYTVNISGSPDARYGHATLDLVKITTTGTRTYTSKPTIAVYVSSSRSTLQSSCKVTLNGTTVKSGYGSYTADIGDADTVNIKFNAVKSGSYTYYTCDITTQKSSSGGGSGGGDHFTNINGAGYEIEGATVRMNGVAYEIESGMTRVNGVAREIAFSSGFVVTITGEDPGMDTGNELAWVTINGTKYRTPAVVEVEAGTVITAGVFTLVASAEILVNGVSVKYSFDRRVTLTYEYTVNGNIEVQLGLNGSRYAVFIIEE